MARLRLEEFDPGSEEDSPPDPSAQALTAAEEAKLAGYEQGYQAGWDDAVAAQGENQSVLKTDLARNLQALSFTWQEVRAHMLTALEPLLTGMVDRLLPETARETLAPVVLQQLMPLAEQALDEPAVLVLNPVVRAPVEALVREATGLPLRIEEEPTLAEGQVYLRLGPAEAKVDLTRAIAEITAAVRGFFTLAQERGADG